MDLATIRLPEELVRALDRIAEARSVTRSEIVREAIQEYCKSVVSRRRTGRVALLQSLVTYPGSGKGDLATRSEQHLRRIFDERRRRRPR